MRNIPLNPVDHWSRKVEQLLNIGCRHAFIWLIQKKGGKPSLAKI